VNSISFLKEALANNYINPALYGRHNVKRGLRNADSTGVLVGLTRIGDVHGYILDEGEKVPVEGRLYYRGINVEDLVRRAQAENRPAFEEAVYLLLCGSLPTRAELERFYALLGENRELPENFVEDSIMKTPSRDVMNKLARSVLALYSYDDDPESQNPEQVLRQSLALVSRLPTIAAYGYMAKKHYYDRESLILHQPDPCCQTAAILLSLIRPDRRYTPLEAEILDLALALHAEHGGGNNSTFAVHLVSSTATDTYSAIAAGIASLKGCKHGGANLKVTQMMEDLKQKVRRWDEEGAVANYLVSLLRGEEYDHTGIIYGQGHAVYTLSDPRALLLREKAEALAAEKGLLEEYYLYRLVEALSPALIREIRDTEKEICANVDFYSGFVYRMLGIPPEFYTPLFAVSRIAGWCAHRLEEVVSGGRIIRPAYKCVQKRRPYVPLDSR